MRGGWRSTTWQKGMSSPNPGGRPKALHDVQELARQHTEAAINALAKIMNDDEAPIVLAFPLPRPCFPVGGDGQFSRQSRHRAVRVR